jgi:hypothetical protein
MRWLQTVQLRCPCCRREPGELEIYIPKEENSSEYPLEDSSEDSLEYSLEDSLEYSSEDSLEYSLENSETYSQQEKMQQLMIADSELKAYSAKTIQKAWNVFLINKQYEAAKAILSLSLSLSLSLLTLEEISVLTNPPNERVRHSESMRV